MRKINKVKGLSVHHKIKRSLRRLVNSRSIPRSVWQRANIILEAIKGVVNAEIGILYGIGRNAIGRWVNRFAEALPILNRIARKRPESLPAKLLDVLSDRQRPGRMRKFDSVCRAFIIGVACNDPSDYGFVRSHWSLPILREAIIAKGIASSISPATISRVLNEADLKPHKNRYWLHSTEKDENPFNLQAESPRD